MDIKISAFRTRIGFVLTKKKAVKVSGCLYQSFVIYFDFVCYSLVCCGQLSQMMFCATTQKGGKNERGEVIYGENV